MNAQSLKDQQKQLAHIRRIKPQAVEPELNQRYKQRFDYKTVEVFIRDGVRLDEKRSVLKAWKRTAHDGLYRFSYVSTNEGEKLDFGDGPGVSDDSNGPFKVRVLAPMRGFNGDGFIDVGQVIEVPATRYCIIRSAELARETSGLGARPRFEPVPDETPLRGPVLPAGFPSHLPKAFKMAAKDLNKPEKDLTFSEVVKWFGNRKPSGEVVAA
jgi:hypothetical protein